MNESILLILSSFLIGAAIIWFFMRKKINHVNEILSDKKVVINELAEYAQKIEKTQEDAVVKKSSKNKPTKKTTDKPKTKNTKKVKSQ